MIPPCRVAAPHYAGASHPAPAPHLTALLAMKPEMRPRKIHPMIDMRRRPVEDDAILYRTVDTPANEPAKR
jgi:hypothetical protein